MKELVRIKRFSSISRKTNTMEMELDLADLAAWENGTLIQKAMPYLSPNQREFLMTGILPEEWDNIFSKETK